MKYALLALIIVFASPILAHAKTKKSKPEQASSTSPTQVIGVLVNKKKLPKDERAFIEDLTKYRWTVHKKGLQLNGAPSDSVIFDVGLRLGDVVATVNDHPMNGAEAIFSGIKSVREEQKCTMLVFRDNRFIQFNVTAR